MTLGVAVLGATGSIGDSTLDVLARHPADFRVVALAAGRNLPKMREQCLRFRPAYAALADREAAKPAANPAAGPDDEAIEAARKRRADRRGKKRR